MLRGRPHFPLLHLNTPGGVTQVIATQRFSKREQATSAPSKPEIGASALANGITTNYLEGGTGDQKVMPIHGSGPGVTAYANWRLVIPALAE